MEKTILFLTDLSNGVSEDLITSEYLKKNFNVTISYFENIEKIEDDFDLIIMRNTWPSDHSKFNIYNKLKIAFLERAKSKKLRVYNDLSANCDRKGKDYLIELYKNSFPVIPSIDSINNLDLLPKMKQYLIKPKNGFSSIGIKTIQKEDLTKIILDNYVIQPKINFQHEISFHFVDKEFLYCLVFEPSKDPVRPTPKYYEPTEDELQFARKFIDWNKMQFGVCRVDALRTNEGELLMLEIEDDSPYFSINEIDEKLRELFLDKMMKSVENVLHIWR